MGIHVAALVSPSKASWEGDGNLPQQGSAVISHRTVERHEPVLVREL